MRITNVTIENRIGQTTYPRSSARLDGHTLFIVSNDDGSNAVYTERDWREVFVRDLNGELVDYISAPLTFAGSLMDTYRIIGRMH